MSDKKLSDSKLIVRVANLDHYVQSKECNGIRHRLSDQYAFYVTLPKGMDKTTVGELRTLTWTAMRAETSGFHSVLKKYCGVDIQEKVMSESRIQIFWGDGWLSNDSEAVSNSGFISGHVGVQFYSDDQR